MEKGQAICRVASGPGFLHAGEVETPAVNMQEPHPLADCSLSIRVG